MVVQMYDNPKVLLEAVTLVEVLFGVISGYLIFSMLLGVSEPNDVNSFPPVRLTSPFPLHQAQI